MKTRRFALWALMLSGIGAFGTAARGQDLSKVPESPHAVFAVSPSRPAAAAPTGSFSGLGISGVLAAIPITGVPDFPLYAPVLVLPYPVAVLPGGNPGQAIVSLQTTTYGGNVNAFYFLIQNGTILSQGRANGSLPPGIVATATFTFDVPASPGPAQLVGTVVGGGSISSLLLPITIQ